MAGLGRDRVGPCLDRGQVGSWSCRVVEVVGLIYNVSPQGRATPPNKNQNKHFADAIKMHYLKRKTNVVVVFS